MSESPIDTEADDRRRFDLAMDFARVYYHLGLKPSSVFLLLGRMLRRLESVEDCVEINIHFVHGDVVVTQAHKPAAGGRRERRMP